MANSNPTREIETLAADIGDKVYIDVAKWHLYLSDAHLHTTVAEQVYPLLENKTLDEDQVQDILRNISVKLGGGRKQVSLLDLLPQGAVSDLVALLEDYQKQF